MRRSFFLLWCLIFFGAGAVSASALLQAEQCHVPADQVIEGNLYVLCQRLVVEGRVTGDVVGAALTADIDGRVDGSVTMLAGRLNVRGIVGSDIYVAGPVIYLRPEARLSSPSADVYTFALTTQVNTPITGNVNGAGYELLIGAPVSGHINFAGTSLTIDAPVGGDVVASVGSSTDTSQQLRTVTNWIEPELVLGAPGLTVTENGAIGGRLVYSSPNPGTLNGPVGGGVTYERVVPSSELAGNGSLTDAVGGYLQAVLRDYVATVLVGVVLILALPRAVRSSRQAIYRKPLPSFSVGLITFVLSFPAFLLALIIGLAIVMLISLLGFSDFTITAAFVIGLLVVAAGALFYFTAVLVSRVVVAVTVARPLARRLGVTPDSRVELLAALAIGGLFLAAASALPVVGILVTALITFIGLGAILIAMRRTNGAARPGSPAGDDESPHAPPPPRLLPRGPGTENLPDGFTWWE
ncbi:MAG: hypothetical protein JNL34_16695 [Anaerolineae bacterium]|nr:hypothetical protein [Anaerolineae bacterium]